MSRKRKHHPRDNTPPPHTDSPLFIQAYEADLVRAPHAQAAARSLEVLYANDNEKPIHVGSGLINSSRVSSGGDVLGDGEDVLQLGKKAPVADNTAVRDDTDALWVDRYDARLLLDALPDLPSSAPAPDPGSPSGWSDLPSDAEDTFFFSPDEADDYRRHKRRRTLDRLRAARMRALPAAPAPAPADGPAQWGASDEEPDDAAVRELMRRTAAHVCASPNPAQLEMRILAHHGADPRFAFLRGRWARAWRTAKGRARLDRAQPEPQASALGGLAGYGDSDEDAASGGDEGQTAEPAQPGASPASEDDIAKQVESDDEVKKARRIRAKEWAEKRRATKAA